MTAANCSLHRERRETPIDAERCNDCDEENSDFLFAPRYRTFTSPGPWPVNRLRVEKGAVLVAMLLLSLLFVSSGYGQAQRPGNALIALAPE